MSRLRPLLLVLLLLIIAVAAYFWWQSRQPDAPALALCPGPDGYGYACESGAGFAYIDATTNTGLYEDDGTIALAIPFPFTFYGTTYNSLNASSNGNLQFGSNNPTFANSCLYPQPAADMGDLIAPYWDDLTLAFAGFLEYDIVGQAPNRIMVIEWDNVPRFGNDEDVVTFEVQLFEDSNDIVFLYEDSSSFEGNHGSSATIGLQSELQAMALQYGCDQPVVADTGKLYFPHPDKPKRGAGLETSVAPSSPYAVVAKGETAVLLQTPIHSLPQLQQDWINGRPSILSQSEWVDMDGDGQDELIILRRGTAQQPHLSQITLIAITPAGDMELLLDDYLSTRDVPITTPALLKIQDFNSDGRTDILLGNDQHQFLLTIPTDGQPILISDPRSPISPS
jgi:hypothetical protein